MKKITIISMLVLLASWWVVGQANSKFYVDECNYEEVCEEWCEDTGDRDECDYEEVCEEWCEDDDDCDDGECDDDDCDDGECDDDDCDDGECDDDDCEGGECDDGECDNDECDDGGDPDPNPDTEGELCIPMDNIVFDLDIGGFLKFIGYIDLN